MTVMWISIALTGILGVPFVLLWWRVADQWADSEHKRFKVTKDTRERVVIRSPDRAEPQPVIADDVGPGALPPSA